MPCGDRTTFRILAILLASALSTKAGAAQLSGKVVDSSGNGIPGAWVGLTRTLTITDTGIAKVVSTHSTRLVLKATLTADDGSWALDGSAGIESSHQPLLIASSKHLTLRDGHLQLSFADMDIAGRTMAKMLTKEKNNGGTQHSPRTAWGSDTIVHPDTLYFLRGADILASQAISSESSSYRMLIANPDLRTYAFDNKRLTLNHIVDAEVSGCGSDSKFSLNLFSSPPSTYPLTWTKSGFELLRRTESGYQFLRKYRRLEGKDSSLIGRFLFYGEVARPMQGTIVSDSTAAIIAADSVAMESYWQSAGISWTFGVTGWSETENQHIFAKLFLLKWNGVSSSLFSEDDSSGSWRRRSSSQSNSTRYDINVEAISSDTIRMTGNVTKEVVTIGGSWGWVRFNKTYRSSNPSHAMATEYANTIVCPSGEPSWYSEFLAANVRAATIIP